jgi:MarR family transcriptional regulator, organic hydroperoxide resistance regulator
MASRPLRTRTSSQKRFGRKIVEPISPVRGRESKAAAHSMDKLPPDDAVLREFVADLYAAFARMRILRKTIARTMDLSSAEYSVLLGVWYLERRGETTVSTLADHLHVAAAHTTAEVGKLVKLGLLIKAPHSKDKRAVGIRLSRTGHELFERVSPMLREINDYLFAGIHYPEMVVAHRFFQRIIEQMPPSLRVAQSYVRT